MFRRPVLHDLGLGYFFPELCELLRTSVLHLSSHYQESVLWRSLGACTNRSEQKKMLPLWILALLTPVLTGPTWVLNYKHVINKGRNFQTVFLKYWADVGRETGHVPPCKDTTMSTEAPGSQQLLLGLTLYFSGAVVLTCRGYKGILRPLNNCPPLSNRHSGFHKTRREASCLV